MHLSSILVAFWKAIKKQYKVFSLFFFSLLQVKPKSHMILYYIVAYSVIYLVRDDLIP